MSDRPWKASETGVVLGSSSMSQAMALVSWAMSTDPSSLSHSIVLDSR
jgi:hypothetical protein